MTNGFEAFASEVRAFQHQSKVWRVKDTISTAFLQLRLNQAEKTFFRSTKLKIIARFQNSSSQILNFLSRSTV